jgi:hypothetical protein
LADQPQATEALGNVMNTQYRPIEYEFLRPLQGNKAEPQVIRDPYPRVIDWGMPEDVHAGDFTFAVLEAALAAGASEIQLTPIEDFGEVSVHFKIGSAFIAQEPLTQIQFGLIAILLAQMPHRVVTTANRPRSFEVFKQRMARNIRFAIRRFASRTAPPRS